MNPKPKEKKPGVPVQKLGKKSRKKAKQKSQLKK
jgi:hypothetical protein